MPLGTLVEGYLARFNKSRRPILTVGITTPVGCGGMVPDWRKQRKQTASKHPSLLLPDCRRDVSSCLRLRSPCLPHHNKLCIIINLFWLQARASSHSNRKKKLILEPSSVRGNRGGLGAKENGIFILASDLRMALENIKKKKNNNRPKPCL